MGLRGTIKGAFNEIEKEDEAWKSEFSFLSEDEYEAEQLKQEFLQIEDVHENPEKYEMSPERYSIVIMEFVEGDFIEFLNREVKELNAMSADSKKVEKRVSDILALIDSVDTLLEYMQSIENKKGNNFGRDTRKKRKKLQIKLNNEDSKLNKFKQKFHEIREKAKFG